MEMLIKDKGQEPGFSFYVAPDYPGNYIYKELHRKDDPPQRQYSFIEALYPRYFKPLAEAKYRFLVLPR
jgi:hypothetical protein